MSGHTPAEEWRLDPNDECVVEIRYMPFRVAAAYCGTPENARVVLAAPETAAELERAQKTIADLVEALQSGFRHSSGCYHIDADTLEAAVKRAETSDAD